MRNKLSYLIGVALLLCCSTSTFTSCLEIDDSIDTVASGGGVEDSRFPKIGGTYFEDEDVDNELYMTYNGKSLIGRKVMLTPDEKNESAIFSFSGTETDLSGIFSGLLTFRYTNYSPIPGIRKFTVSDVKLNPMEDDKTYSFSGEYNQHDGTYDDFEMTFTGTVREGEMKIDIQNKILNEELLGTWGLDDVVTAGSAIRAIAGDALGSLAGAGPFRESNACTPLWIDWNSPQEIDLGKLPEVLPPDMFESLLGGLDQNIASVARTLSVKGTPNKLIGIIFTDDVASAIGVNPENIIKNMLRDAILDRTGNMYFSYSYTGDMFNPPTDWGGGKDDNSSNYIVRYYYDKKIKEKFYLEINPTFLLSAINGLTGTLAVSTTSNTRASDHTISTRADQYNTIAIGKRLIEKLTPALQAGIPCYYEHSENGKIKINIDGEYLRDVLRIIAELVNDEFAYDEITKFLKNDATLKDFMPTVLKLIKQLPATLDSRCKYVNLGFKMHKTADLAPEEPENPDPVEPDPENPTPENLKVRK